MDIGALASSLTTALVPLLPYLLKAGETAAEETGKTVAVQTLEWGKSLWGKLRPKLETKPGALEAAQDAAQTTDDDAAQAAFRRQLRKLLEEDQSLAEEVSRWLEQGKAAGLTVTASGERSVAIGGDVKGSTAQRVRSRLKQHRSSLDYVSAEEKWPRITLITRIGICVHRRLSAALSASKLTQRSRLTSARDLKFPILDRRPFRL